MNLKKLFFTFLQIGKFKNSSLLLFFTFFVELTLILNITNLTGNTKKIQDNTKETNNYFVSVYSNDIYSDSNNNK